MKPAAENDHFVHAHALCESTRIGRGTRIWAFAHVLAGAQIGMDCNVCDHVFIENDVVVGDRVTIKCGVQLWDGVRLENDVFVGPNATFSNDKYPRSKQHPARFLETRVECGASIGANATILPGIIIGQGAMVGAGAVVTSNVQPGVIVVGVPARVVGYTTDDTSYAGRSNVREVAQHGAVTGANLFSLRQYSDARGRLVVAEHPSDLPFSPARSFLVFAVPNSKVRGEHAHRLCKQVLVAAHGSLQVTVDDGTARQTFFLDDPSTALFVPAGVWASQHHFSRDAALLVFASKAFDDSDYIRDYEAFRRFSNVPSNTSVAD